MDNFSDSYYVQTTEYDPEIEYSDNSNLNVPVSNLLITDTENKNTTEIIYSDENTTEINSSETETIENINNKNTTEIILDKQTATSMYKQTLKNNQSGGGNNFTNLVGMLYENNINKKVFIDGFDKINKTIIAHDLLNNQYFIPINKLTVN